MKSEKESPVISLGLWNQKETNEVRGYFEPRAGGEVKIFGFYYNKKRKKACTVKRKKGNRTSVVTVDFLSWLACQLQSTNIVNCFNLLVGPSPSRLWSTEVQDSLLGPWAYVISRVRNIVTRPQSSA